MLEAWAKSSAKEASIHDWMLPNNISLQRGVPIKINLRRGVSYPWLSSLLKGFTS